jgi:cell division protein FtsQ
MQRIRFLTFFTIAFVLGTGALFAFLYHMGLFEVRAIPVELVSGQTDSAHPSSQGVADKKLQGRIESVVQDLRGKKIWEIDLSKMRAAIANDEWVKDVLISRVLPNQVRVLVRSKEISLLYLNKHNEFFPVTDGGAFLSMLPRGAMPEVPVLRGEIFVKEPQRRAEMIKFVRSLADNGPMGMHNVSEVGWASDDGYTLTLIQPKVEVKLGEEKLDLKAMRVAQVLNYLSANNLKGRVIDASFSKKVLVRLRKGP